MFLDNVREEERRCEEGGHSALKYEMGEEDTSGTVRNEMEEPKKQAVARALLHLGWEMQLGTVR